MLIDHKKYFDLFTIKYKADANEFTHSYEDFIHRNGNSPKSNIRFYCYAFDSIVKQYKTGLPKDENYEYIITYLYTSFISAIEQDGADATKYKNEFQHFKEKELPNITISPTPKPIYQEPTYKRYTLNTKYGRRKAREQAHLNYEHGSREYRAEIDSIRIVFWIIAIII